MEEQKDVGSLQVLINKRAEERLNNDLVALSKSIWENPLMNSHDSPKLYFKKTGSETVQAIREGFEKPERVYLIGDIITGSNTMNAWKIGREFKRGEYMEQLFQFWLPKYIEEETQIFINRINELEEQMEYLKDSVQTN